MRRFLSVAVGAAAAAIAAIVAVAPGHAAAIAAVEKAEQQFAALGANAYKTGQPPRMSDPKVAALLDVVFDLSDLPLTGTPPFSQIEDLSKKMQAIAQVGLIYTLAGTGAPSLAVTAKLGDMAKLSKQINHNTVAFAPEMGAYFDGELVVETLVLKCVAHELQANPGEFTSKLARHGLAQIRNGATQTIDGIFYSLTIAGESDHWRRARMAGLIAIAPTAARFLLPEERKKLHDDALVGAKQSKDLILRTGYRGIAEALGG
ncbi:MAG: hypothetical protein ACREFD_08505 [Stellaceae bacterium]